MGAPEFIYVPDLALDPIETDPDNERQTARETSFYGLVGSIRRKGILTPIGVEEYEPRRYKVIFGNRRVLAAKQAGLTTIKAKVYRPIDEAIRYEMQVAENATKVKIPLEETAENLWEYYKYLVETEIDGNYTSQHLANYPSYWHLPPLVREEYSMARFGERTGFSESVIRDAFLYVNLDPRIKERVLAGRVSYSFALELGRLSDYGEQYGFLERVLAGQRDPDNRDPIKNKDQMGRAVTKYLTEKSRRDPLFSMLVEEESVRSPARNPLEREISDATRILGNLTAMLEYDRNLIHARGTGKAASFNDILERYQKAATDLREILMRRDGAAATLEKLQKPRRRLDDILAGTTAEGGGAQDSIAAARYALVPISVVYVDEDQPRKTFDEEKLGELAATIERIGLLSPPLVKPMPDGRYRLIVGHRRTAASRKAGVTTLEVLVCDIPDEVCREIQYEEDIHERVILSERAEKLYRLYLLRKRHEEDKGNTLSLHSFAKEYSSIGANAVLHAIIFASLPPTVKQMHQSGLLYYSTAVAIAQEAERELRNKMKEHLRTLYGAKEHYNGEEESAARAQILLEWKEEEWIRDWTTEAAILGYNAKTARRKIQEDRTQITFDFFSQGKEEGRRALVAKQATEAIEIMDVILAQLQLPKMKMDSDLFITLLRYVLGFEALGQKIGSFMN